jgi:hypothetical protein
LAAIRFARAEPTAVGKLESAIRGIRRFLADRSLNGLLGQTVGVGIVFAADVSNGELPEARYQRLAGIVDVEQRRALASVGAADLASCAAPRPPP